MKDTLDIARMKKIVLILFAVVVCIYLIPQFLPLIPLGILLSLVFEFGCLIAMLVFSIKLIRKKQLAFGIAFSGISTICIIYFIIQIILLAPVLILMLAWTLHPD